MKRQTQPDGKSRSPDFRCSGSLAASLLMVVLCVSSAQEVAPGKKSGSGRRKIMFEDTLEVYRKPALEVFGEKSLPPVKTGMLFLDGKYVPPPYRLSRKGNFLLVNSRRLAKYAWPPSSLSLIGGKPEIPKSVLKTARKRTDLKITKDDMIRLGIDPDFYRPGDYDDLMASFFRFNYLPRTSTKKYVAEIRRYPFVSHVELLPAGQNGMRIHYKDGTVFSSGVASPCYTPVFHIPGNRTISKEMDKQLDSLHKELSTGNLVIWDSSWLFIRKTEDVEYKGHALDRMPITLIQSEFPKVIEIIARDAPLKKRAWALMVQRLFKSRKAAEWFITAFTTDPEFRRRLKILQNPRP